MVRGTGEGAGVAVQTKAGELWALSGAAWNLRPLAKCVSLTPCLPHWGLPTRGPQQLGLSLDNLILKMLLHNFNFKRPSHPECSCRCLDVLAVNLILFFLQPNWTHGAPMGMGICLLIIYKYHLLKEGHYFCMFQEKKEKHIVD